ncbi:MAG: NAD(P)H-dependent glycerol-3-phosphate dehydrogenase [Halanaerobiaceae bacterium]
MARIGIVGGGSWGTALAETLARCGHQSNIYVRREKLAREINNNNINHDYFPEYKLSAQIQATNSLQQAVEYGSYIMLAVPTHVLRETADKISQYHIQDKIIISTAKGIEEKSFMRNSEIISGLGFENIVVLSGPTHAEEVIEGNPSAAVVAAEEIKQAQEVQQLLMSKTFRIYTSTDLCGVELAGAVKNIIAIAAGIAAGLGYGDNTRAALVTRGLAEIRRLGSRLGGKSRTFSGLAGLGDLVVTCGSQHSRNFRFGYHIGQGLNSQQAREKIGQVVEGIKTTAAVYNMVQQKSFNIELPITKQIYMVLFDHKSPLQAVDELMLRDPKRELE